jgi:hypothetical protein
MLVRIAKSEVCREGSRLYVDQRVTHVNVSFEGPDGRVVSVAFDGRCERDGLIDGSVCEGYGTFRDCPVIDGDDRQSGPVSDLQAMRILRDALIAMDLGE